MRKGMDGPEQNTEGLREGEDAVDSSSPQTFPEDHVLVSLLRQGDEAAFALLLDRYSPSLLNLALIYVSNQALAEEVLQDTWFNVFKNLGTFEGRSSLKTWIFHILLNRAKKLAQRENRTLPLSSLNNEEENELVVDTGRFKPAGKQGAGHWIHFPVDWSTLPEQHVLSQETVWHIRQAIACLPVRQRAVITLRDVEGWTAEEVCQVLELSEQNQRILLHRARSKVRRALGQYLEGK